MGLSKFSLNFSLSVIQATLGELELSQPPLSSHPAQPLGLTVQDSSENPKGHVILPSCSFLASFLALFLLNESPAAHIMKYTHFSTFLLPHDHPSTSLWASMSGSPLIFSQTNLAPSALRCSWLRVPHLPECSIVFLCSHVT